MGRGAFGSVFKVRCRVNNEIRAMKIISKQSQNQNENFRQEFSVLKKYPRCAI